jgi:hypothetical protein
MEFLFITIVSLMFIIFLIFHKRMSQSNPFLATKIEYVEQRPYKAIHLHKGLLGSIHNGDLQAQIEYLPGEFVVREHLKAMERSIPMDILQQLNLNKVYFTVTDPTLDAFGRLVYELNIFAYQKKD